MLRLLFLTVLITLSSAGNVTFTDCGNNEVTLLDITGCSGSTCSVKVGNSLTFTSKFVANQDSSTATMALTVQLGEVKAVLSLDDTDACKIITPTCPLKKGQTYATKFSHDIDPILTGTQPVISGTITGANGVLLCASVALNVTA